MKRAAIPSSICSPRTLWKSLAKPSRSSWSRTKPCSSHSGVGLASLAVLLWMILAGPGYLGYGAHLLWAGQRTGAAPLYDLRVAPGDASVRRNADQLVTALPIGMQTDKVRLYARYQSTSKWEQVQMQPQPSGFGLPVPFRGASGKRRVLRRSGRRSARATSISAWSICPA